MVVSLLGWILTTCQQEDVNKDSLSEPPFSSQRTWMKSHNVHWLVGVEPNSQEKGMLYKGHACCLKGGWKGLSQQTRQVAEMTKRCSPSHPSVLLLMSVIIFLCSLCEFAMRSTPSANLKFDVQEFLSSSNFISKPFSLMADCRTELQNKDGKASLCFVPLEIRDDSLSRSAKTVAVWPSYIFSKRLLYCSLTDWFLRDLHIASWWIKMNAFWMAAAASHMLTLHSLHFNQWNCTS